MSYWKRIAEDLREQVAALTNERDEALRVTFDVRVIEQLAAAQATIDRLREALKEEASCGKRIGVFASTVEALALPNDTTALDARLAQERKEIADTCDRFHERGMTPAECAAHIRSMT